MDKQTMRMKSIRVIGALPKLIIFLFTLSLFTLPRYGIPEIFRMIVSAWIIERAPSTYTI